MIKEKPFDPITEMPIGSNSVQISLETAPHTFEQMHINWSTLSEILDVYNLKGKGDFQDIVLEQEDVVFFREYFVDKKLVDEDVFDIQRLILLANI